MSQLLLRPFIPADLELLEKWRRLAPPDVGVGLPYGYGPEFALTAVAEKEHRILAALTGTLALVIGPVVKNPEASRVELTRALIELVHILEFAAAQRGAVDSYIMVQRHLQDFKEQVVKMGYTEETEDLVVLSKTLLGSDVVATLHDMR